jgi:hypothetical protein
MAVVSRASQNWCRPTHRYPPSHCACLKPDEPPKRPDPAIYSQVEQLSLGLAPTWNPDDITTNRQRPWTLLLEATAIVRNLSTEVSAVNTLVHFFTSPFGIATQRTLLSSQPVNLAPGAQTTLVFPMTQALLAGDPRIGAHVVIEHPHDSKAINNRGSQTVFGVFTTDVGRNLQFDFPVVNNSGAARQITLSLVPNSLGAVVTPAVHNFAPWEQMLAHVTAHVPGTVHGTPASPVRNDITVIGWAAGGVLIDGVTFVVRADD